MGWSAHTVHRSTWLGRGREAVALLAAGMLTLSAVVAGASPAQAEVVGSQFQVSSGNDDYLSVSAYDSTNQQHLVVWENYDSKQLRGQLVDASGSPVGSSFVIAAFTEWYPWSPPSVSYNASGDEFLVAWDDDDQVFAQRITASDGSLTGSKITVSAPQSDSIYVVEVAWSPDASKYLVAWDQSDNIHGRLVAADGTVSGTTDLHLSNLQSSVDPYPWAWQVDLVYNTVADQFLVTWIQGDNESDDAVWGQRVANDGTPVSTTDFQISNTSFGDAAHSSIAFDPTNNQYLVVFTNPTMSSNGAEEVFGQLVAADASMVGSTFQISNRVNYDVGMGVLEPLSQAGVTGPDVAYDPTTGRYLAVFSSSPTHRNSWLNNEVYGDYITSAGALVGTRDFQVSDMGAWQNPYTVGMRPSVDFDSTAGEFMTFWFGVTLQGSLTDDDYNVWGSRVAGSEPASPPTDTTAPETAIHLTGSSLWPIVPNGAGWFKQTVYIKARAFDGLTGSGISQVRCAVDPASVPATFADLPDEQCAASLPYVSTEGQHTIYAASIDNQGNTSSVVSKDVWIDMTAPTLAPTVSPSSTLVLNQSGASASPNATDALSGVASSSCDTPVATTVGEHSVGCTATDNAGNTNTGSATYLVGYKTAFVSPTDGANYAAGKAASINVTLGDNNNTLISTADGVAMAKAQQVKVSLSGAVTLAPTSMKYSRSSGEFSYRLRIPRAATTGTATITVTIQYTGTLLNSTATRTINII